MKTVLKIMMLSLFLSQLVGQAEAARNNGKKIVESAKMVAPLKHVKPRYTLREVLDAWKRSAEEAERYFGTFASPAGEYLIPAKPEVTEVPIEELSTPLTSAVREMFGDKKSIKGLDLSGPGYASLEGIDEVPGISEVEVLNLNFCKVTDLSPLIHLPNLKLLLLLHNPPIVISQLKHFKNIIGVQVGGSDVRDIHVKMLGKLHWLKQLNLMISQVRDISPLTKLKKLEILHLGGNNLSDISPLKKLRNLRDLSLLENRITDISPLKSLKKLRLLSLYKNNVKDVSPLEKLKKLEFLELVENPITQLDISDNPKLTFVDVRDTPIDPQAIKRNDNPDLVVLTGSSED